MAPPQLASDVILQPVDPQLGHLLGPRQITFAGALPIQQSSEPVIRTSVSAAEATGRPPDGRSAFREGPASV